MSPPDHDLGPTATAMERGYDQTYYQTARSRSAKRATASWHGLVKNLQRRSTAAEARDLIEHRVPPAAVAWLRHLIQEQDWTSLRSLARTGAPEAEISAAALREAQMWEDMRPKPKQPKSSKMRKARLETEDQGALKI